MKKTRKMLAMLLSMMLVAVVAIGGTYAYLTSTTGVVENTFTVGNVVITLDEADTDNSTADKDRDMANAYHLIPGATYTKDPIIHVAAGSEDCWLFVKVVNGLDDIEATGNTSIAAQMAAKGWTETSTAGVYQYGTTAVAAGANVVVFETLTIANDIDNATLAANARDTITIKACAVQAEGVDQATALTEAVAKLG